MNKTNFFAFLAAITLGSGYLSAADSASSTAHERAQLHRDIEAAHDILDLEKERVELDAGKSLLNAAQDAASIAESKKKMEALEEAQVELSNIVQQKEEKLEQEKEDLAAAEIITQLGLLAEEAKMKNSARLKEGEAMNNLIDTAVDLGAEKALDAENAALPPASPSVSNA